MARWITVRQRFDFRWPSGAITHFSDAELGEHHVKDELADFAVEKGYATEGKLDETKRSTKGTGAKVRSSRRKGKTNAKAADSGTVAPVGDADAADADRPADRPAVDSDPK
jgi:hypothetical protein